ncbi:MAG: hypothetical protein ACREGL_09815 [Alphaproteobacteria bacterium]
MREVMLAALLCLALVLPARAGMDEGTEAYERGEYAAAFEEYAVLAHMGDAAAQFALGTMYSQGQGVPQDYAEAYFWWTLASLAGDRLAEAWAERAAKWMWLQPGRLAAARARVRAWHARFLPLAAEGQSSPVIDPPRSGLVFPGRAPAAASPKLAPPALNTLPAPNP